MADNDRKLVSAADLPSSLGEAPPKRSTTNSADVASFAKFGNISPERASKILESKDGRSIRAVADGLVPPLVEYISRQVTPLLNRIADLERKLAANMKTIKAEAAQIHDWQGVLRGEQRVVKTIRTRRDENGDLVADVFSADDASIKYRGIWTEGIEYSQGDFVTDRGSMHCALVSTRKRPGTSDDWQLAIKRGKDGKDGRDAK